MIKSSHSPCIAKPTSNPCPSATHTCFWNTFREGGRSHTGGLSVQVLCTGVGIVRAWLTHISWEWRRSSTHHPSSRTGALPSDVVTNSPVLAGAAQLALGSVAAGGTQLLAALGRENDRKHNRRQRDHFIGFAGKSKWGKPTTQVIKGALMQMMKPR